MNFIAACFLYHTDEVYAFWLFVHLIETLGMNDVYKPGKSCNLPFFHHEILTANFSRLAWFEKTLSVV